MKINKLIPTIALVTAAFAPNFLSAQSLTNLGYGNQIAGGATLFLDEGSTALATSGAVFSLGYFSSVPVSFTAEANTFDNWVSLSETFTSPSVAGFVSTVHSNLNVAGAVGTVPYLAVFVGVTDIASYASAAGFTLLQDSAWGGITAGAGTLESPVTDSEYRTLAFDSVLIGNVVVGAGFSGGDGIAATIVPEPSTYAALAGLCALGAVALRRRRA
tara:strand:- start:109 stop:756 length:648 start_codon:yes stop_codon:yes gene_type:complete